jgi:hypothetical protein
MGNVQMTIQATFTGNITGQAKFQPATRQREAMVSFSVFAGPQHLSDRDYIRCRLKGRKAEALHHYLVAGKKVLLSGDLRLVLVGTERPFLGCAVNSIELLGGGSHPLPHEVAAFDAHDDEEIER